MKNTRDAEIVATRRTFDGATVNLHASGEVSFRTHFLRGRLPLASMWKMAADICLYTAAEVPALLRSVKTGAWRPFRVVFPPPASAIYRAIRLANGGEVLLRIS